MHSSSLLTLAALGSFAAQALADNAHLKVQFFADAYCRQMKPDNDHNPSDLNPRKNECERPDHHLPSGGFAFRSIKYSFRGDDWKSNLEKKYSSCTLHAFHAHDCVDAKKHMLRPDWTLDHTAFYEDGNSTTVCHSLTDFSDDDPFYSLMLDCRKQEKKEALSSPQDVVIVAEHHHHTVYTTPSGVPMEPSGLTGMVDGSLSIHADLGPSGTVGTLSVSVTVATSPTAESSDVAPEPTGVPVPPLPTTPPAVLPSEERTLEPGQTSTILYNVEPETPQSTILYTTAPQSTIVYTEPPQSTIVYDAGTVNETVDPSASTSASLGLRDIPSEPASASVTKPTATGSSPELAVIMVLPSLTDAEDVEDDLVDALAATTPSAKDRRRLHARDVTAKSEQATTSREPVINAKAMDNLLEKLSEDLEEWIDDLSTSVHDVEGGEMEVSCANGDCEVDGDDVWPYSGN